MGIFNGWSKISHLPKPAFWRHHIWQDLQPTPGRRNMEA
jgi:hypothetical protein